PVVRFEAPVDGDFFTPGKAVNYRVAVQDVEEGDSATRPDEFAARMVVTSTFARADGKDAVSEPGLALMKSSDCFNCHAIEQPLVGPSLVAIAEKYRGQSGALDASVRRVREGSTGVWGQVPMLQHPQHTTDEVTLMLRWVFGLEKGKGGPAIMRGLAGEVIAPNPGTGGEFILEATCADAGRAPAGSLSGTARVALRSRTLEGETAQVSGPAIQTKAIGSIDHGHSVRFANVNLADVSAI